jgi:TolA-binding protein
LPKKKDDITKAKVTYKQLLTEYPQSTAAKLAKPRLASLEN